MNAPSPQHRGMSHVGVATHDMEATIAFYTQSLGFPVVADHITEIGQGGRVRQVYFDIGADTYFVFMESKGVPDIPEDFPTGINEALGTPAGMFHFSFKVETREELAERQRLLNEKGIDVSDIIDLGHAESIFFFDPNNLQLEFCWHSRPFDASDLDKRNSADLA